MKGRPDISINEVVDNLLTKNHVDVEGVLVYDLLDWISILERALDNIHRRFGVDVDSHLERAQRELEKETGDGGSCEQN